MLLSIIGIVLIVLGILAFIKMFDRGLSDQEFFIVLIISIVFIIGGIYLMFLDIGFILIIKLIGLILFLSGLFIVIYFPGTSDYQPESMTTAGLFIGFVFLIAGFYILFFM